MRLCASAVVCSRSIASVANATAVSKPKQLVVPTMSLSIVFGTPTIGMPSRQNSWAIASVPSPPIAISASRPSLLEHLDHAIGVAVRALGRRHRERSNGLPVLSVPRIVPPRRRMPVTSRGVSTRERSGSSRPSKLSSMPRVSMPLFQAALDDGADDGVQPGRVAAAGEHADTCDRGHRGESLAGSPGWSRCGRRNPHGTIGARFCGRLAQLGERRVRNAEVTSSSLVSSTILRSHRRASAR